MDDASPPITLTHDTQPVPPPPLWPVAVAVVLVFLLAQALGLGLGILLVFVLDPRAPLSPADFANRLQQALLSPVGFLGAVIVTGAVLSGAAFLGARLDRQPWRERLRLAPSQIRPSHLVLAVLGMLGVGQILDSILALAGWSDAGTLGLLADAVASLRWPGMLAAVVVLGPVAGASEELFFRGFVQTRLRQRLGPGWAVALTALVFGVFHCDLWHSPTAMVMGLYLGWLTERTGSIRPAMLAHSVNNALYVPLVAFGPEEMSVAAHLGLAAIAAAVGTLAVVVLSRAYPTAAVAALPEAEASRE
jgi:membrane protease YdiL (CAAX protease family)